MADLVPCMAEGNSQALNRLIEYYYSRILRVAYLISRNYTDNEDIIQETFMLCWMNQEEIKEPEYFGNWLYKTLTREAWRYYKENREEQPMEEVLGKEEPGTASALEGVMMRSWGEEFYKAIRNPPVKQRAAIVPCCFNQMPVREITGIMGCLGGTVKPRLSTVRANLKQELMEENGRVGREVTL